MLHTQCATHRSDGGVGCSSTVALMTPSTASAPPHASSCLNLTRTFKPGTGALGPLTVPIGTAAAPVTAPTSAGGWLDLGFSIPEGGEAHVTDTPGSPSKAVTERTCYVEALRANKGTFRAWFALGCELEAAERAMIQAAGDDIDVTCFDAREQWFVSVCIDAESAAAEGDTEVEGATKRTYADDCFAQVVATSPVDDAVNAATAYAMLSEYLGRHSRFASVPDYSSTAEGAAPVHIKVDSTQALLKSIALDAKQGPVAFALSKYFHRVREEAIGVGGRTFVGKECFALALSWPGLMNDADAWIMAAEYLSTHPRGEFPPAVKVQDVFHDYPKCLARAATILSAASCPSGAANKQQRETLTSVLLALGETMQHAATVSINGSELTALAVFERALDVSTGLQDTKLWLAMARTLVTPDARATVKGVAYSSTDCYAAAVRCVADAAGQAATTREDKSRLAAALRHVAATVPAGADVAIGDGSTGALSDVALAERAIDLDPMSADGWFALGLALKTFTTARHDLTMEFDASTSTAAEPHSVVVAGVKYTAFDALVKSLTMHTEVAPSISSFLHLVDLLAPGDSHAIVVGGVRVSKKNLAAAVVAHATDRPGAWRLLADALLAEQLLGGLPAANVLMHDVDTRHCFIRALQLSQGASADSWCGLLETTHADAAGTSVSEDPIEVSPQQSFARRECALNALRRSGLKGARAWWNMARTLAEAGYDGNSVTMEEIHNSSNARDDRAIGAVQELLYERDCVLKVLEYATMDEAAVAIKALVRLAEMLRDEADGGATAQVTFRRCVHSVFEQHEFQVQAAYGNADAWGSTKPGMTAEDLAKTAIAAYAAADSTAKCLTEATVRRAWSLLADVAPVTVCGCTFSAEDVKANCTSA